MAQDEYSGSPGALGKTTDLIFLLATGHVLSFLGARRSVQCYLVLLPRATRCSSQLWLIPGVSSPSTVLHYSGSL